MIMEKSLQLKKIYRENVIFMLLLCENVEKNIQKQKSQVFVKKLSQIFPFHKNFLEKKIKVSWYIFRKKIWNESEKVLFKCFGFFYVEKCFSK